MEKAPQVVASSRAWLSVAASALGVGIGLLGLPLLSLGLFIGPLHAQFDWSRAQVSSASLAINAATFIGAPFIGRACDRWGVRPIAVISLAILAAGFAVLSAIGPTFLAYEAIWFVMSLGAVGSTGIVWTRAVGSLFDVGRGLALGATLSGTAFAALLGPLLLGAVISHYGWRAGYATLSLVTAVSLPVCVLFFHDRRSLAAGDVARSVPEESGDSLADALRSRQFWILGAGFFLVVLGMGSLLVHFVPIANDAGLSPSVATRMFAIVGATMLVGRIAIGLSLDRYDARIVAGSSLILPASACLALLHPSESTIAGAAAIIGFCAGAEIDLLAFLVSRCFGMRHYGAIYGSQVCFFAAGSGIGGILTAHLRDVLGSYDPALEGGVVVFVAGALLVAAVGPLRYAATPNVLLGRTAPVLADG